MRSIEDRPGEAAGRQVPGHWEGDLIVGKNGATAAGTLAGRTSRFTAILPLPFGRTAGQLRSALIDQVADLPAQLVKSITWDQGSGMADHAAFSLATKIDVYFAHPAFTVGTGHEREHERAHPGIHPERDAGPFRSWILEFRVSLTKHPPEAYTVTTERQPKCSPRCSAKLLPPVDTALSLFKTARLEVG